MTTAGPEAVERAAVQVQRDIERSLQGAALNHHSMQVGLRRGLIRTYAEDAEDAQDWVTRTDDLAPQGP